MRASWSGGLKGTLLVVFALGATLSAEAVERKGFLIGASGGGGWLQCSYCRQDPDWSKEDGSLAFPYAFGALVGASVSSRTSLALELLVVSDHRGMFNEDHVQLTLSTRYWLSPRLFVGGGLGVGDRSSSPVVAPVPGEGPYYKSDDNLAVVAEMGVELFQRRHFALDLRGRYGLTATNPGTTSQVVVLAGFTWY